MLHLLHLSSKGVCILLRKFTVCSLFILLTLACVAPSDIAVKQAAVPPTRTPLPTFTPTSAVQPTLIIPPTSTSTPVPAPTDTPIPPTDTPVPPTDTPVPPPAEEPTATDTPEPPPPTKAPQPQSQPAEPPAATNTPAPAAPAAGAHGVLGSLTLREGRNTYKSGERIFVKIEAKNTTGSAIPFGILGLTTSDGAFQTSWDNSSIDANGAFHHEDGIPFGGPGNKKIYLSICFSTKEVCQSADGDWERFEPGVDVVVQ